MESFESVGPRSEAQTVANGRRQFSLVVSGCRKSIARRSQVIATKRSRVATDRKFTVAGVARIATRITTVSCDRKSDQRSELLSAR